MVEEKAHCRYVGDHSQRQAHLGESRVDLTRLSCTLWGDVKGQRGGERRTRCSSQKTQTYKESGQSKWLDYIGKGSPSPWAGEFRVMVGCVIQEGPVTGRG